MKIYLFMWRDRFSWKPEFTTISVHRTKLGAFKALQRHKRGMAEHEQYNLKGRWGQRRKRRGEKFGENMDWFIKEMELQDD